MLATAKHIILRIMNDRSRIAADTAAVVTVIAAASTTPSHTAVDHPRRRDAGVLCV